MNTQKVEMISVDKAKEILLSTMKIYFAKDRAGNYRMNRRRTRPICLMGPAGIGKTEVVRQAAEESNMAFLSYSISHHTRQSLIGLPRLTERIIGGKSVFVTEYTMSEIIGEIYRVMKETGKQEGILFLDECNCISESLYPVLLQLMQNKTMGTHAIPDGWMLVLAGNSEGCNQSAREMDVVMADRMRMVWLQPDYAAWSYYMEQRNLHPAIRGYLQSHKKHFYLYQENIWKQSLVTARAWEDLSILLHQMEEKQFSVTLSLIGQYIHDRDVARGFYGYYSQYETLFASGLVEDILQGKDHMVKHFSEKSFEQQWNVMNAVLNELRSMAEEALCSLAKKPWKQLEDSLRYSLSVFLHGLQNDVQRQYLFHELAEDDSIMEAMVYLDVPEMKVLFDQVSFQVEDEAELLLQEVKREKKQEQRKNASG